MISSEVVLNLRKCVSAVLRSEEGEGALPSSNRVINSVTSRPMSNITKIERMLIRDDDISAVVL